MKTKTFNLKYLFFIAFILLIFSIAPNSKVAYAATDKIQLEGYIQNTEKTYGENDPTFVVYDKSNKPINLNIAFTRDKGEDVGEYVIKIDTLKSDNKYDYSKITPAKLKINKRKIELSAINNEKVYGNIDPQLNYILSGGYLIPGDIISNISIKRAIGEDVNVEGYPIQIDRTSVIIKNNNKVVTDNYELNFIDAKFKINKLDVTCEGNDLTIKYLDDINATIKKPIPVFYDNIPSYKFDSINSDVLGQSKLKFSVTFNKDGKDSTLKMLNNLNINYKFGTLTVEKRNLNLIVESQEITYGDNCNINYTTGTSDILAPNHIINGNLSYEQASANKVGTYKIILGNLKIVDNLNNDKSSFYNITINDATLTILPKPINITFNDMTSVYGDDELSFETYDTLLKDELCFDDNPDIHFIRKNSYNKNVGNYEIVTNEQISNNYLLTLVNNNYIISKRNLKVKNTTLSKQYGDVDKVFEWEIVDGNIVNNDFINIEFTRVEGENIGNYAVKLKESEFDNYSVTAPVSTFKITPKQLTIKGLIISNKVYDGNKNANMFLTEDFGLDGIVNGDDVYIVTNIQEQTLYAEFEDEKPGNNKKVYIQNINIDGKDKNNYTITAITKTANITPNIIKNDNVTIQSINSTIIDNGTILNETVNISDTRLGIGKCNIDLYPIILAQYKIDIVKNEKPFNPSGYLQYTVKIPENFENIYGLQIATKDSNDNMILLESTVQDGFLTFKTDLDIDCFYIVAEDDSYLNLTAIITSSVALGLLLIAIVIYVIKKKKKKKFN